MGEELLGRGEDIATLRELLEQRAAAVVLVGEPGVGKTTLARAALESGALHAGAVAALRWRPYQPLRRAVPEAPDGVWDGGPEDVADEVLGRAGDRSLVLDDLHWADSATLEVVDLLAGRLRLVATVRRGDPAAPSVLDRLLAAGFARHDVEGLATADAARLVLRLNPALAGERAADVVARAGGNPLLLEELCRGDGTADTLLLALGRRLDVLSAAAREGMLLLAAAGRPLAASVVPGGTELVDAGLAVATSGDVELVARHGLIAETVLADSDAADVMAAHVRLAELVGDVGARSRHLRAAGQRAAAYAAALEAADEARSPAEQYQHLVTALHCAAVEDRPELVMRAAAAANQALAPEDALAMLDDLPEGWAVRADVIELRGQALFELGDADGWRRTVVDGLEAPDATDAQRRHFRTERAAVAYFVEGDPATAERLAAEVAAEARAVGAPHAAAQRMIGTARYLQGDPRWAEDLQRAVDLARREGDRSGLMAAWNNLISGHESAGDPVLGAQLCDEAVAEARALGMRRLERHLRARRISLATHAGDHLTVERLASSLLAEPVAARTREEVVTSLAGSYADTGRTAEALELGRVHLTASGQRPSDHHAVRALAFLADDRPRAALAERAPFHAAAPVHSMAIHLEPVFAWGALLSGQELPELAGERLDWGMLAGVWPELDGLSHLRGHRYEQAAEAFGVAASLYAPYTSRGATRAAWAHGDALLRAGRREEGLAALAELEAVAARQGLVPVLRRIERSRRGAVGRRGDDARTSASGEPAVTAAERRVLALVGEGLADAEIAARLGVSTRTVQAQVASAMRKLGAVTRHHAAQLVEPARE